MREYLTLPQRVLVLGIYILCLTLVSKLITGAWVPASGGKSLWFFSSIALWFFTRFSAPFFVKPRDAVARSAVAALQLGVIDLASVIRGEPQLNAFRWLSFGLASLTSLVGVVAIFLHQTDRDAGESHAYFSRLTYRFAERFGRGPVVFTPAVLISILGFYQEAPIQQLWLLFVWSILIFLQPVELVFHLIGDFRVVRSKEQANQSVGEIQRIDSPGILRVRLKSAENWKRANIHAACLADSRHVEVLPLFVQTQDAELIGTGLCHKDLEEKIAGARAGEVFLSPDGRKKDELMKELCGCGGGGELIGFVIENSTISQIQFEVSTDVTLREGCVVTAFEKTESEDRWIYYQITNASTDEESFSQNPLGRHIARAEQLGLFDSNRGFIKHGWLPVMNSPVFLPSESAELVTALSDDEFPVGTVPYSKIAITANLNDLAEYHTAILGVTGTGKTEFAYDILRFALKRGFKVFCVDLTAEYDQRLKDLEPSLLELEEADSNELNRKIFEVETSDFSGGKEKAALKEEIDKLKPKIEAQIAGFLEPENGAFGHPSPR